MKLLLREIKEFSTQRDGVTNFTGYKSNGHLYVFENENGDLFTKYSFNIWSSVVKYRTKIANDIQILIKKYKEFGMRNDAEMIENELPNEGDIYEFNFTHKLNEYNQNSIQRILK